MAPAGFMYMLLLLHRTAKGIFPLMKLVGAHLVILVNFTVLVRFFFCDVLHSSFRKLD